MPPSRIDHEQLRELIEVQKLQQWRAAELLKVSESCVERTCKRLGLKTAKTGPRRGPGHPDWKGGRTVIGGYWHIWAPDHPNATKAGYVAEHRMLMGLSLNRPLLADEVVHHIDGNPQNNDLSNLMLFQTNAEHLRHELIGKVPNWTPEGKERIQEVLEQNAKRHRGIKRDGSGHIRTTDHPPSKP